VHFNKKVRSKKDKETMFMTLQRDAMIKELKSKVVPVLRSKGFRGRYPHFRRFTEESIDLLSVVFDKWGGGFYVELGSSPLEGVTYSDGTSRGPNEVSPFDAVPSLRLGAKSEHGDYWFRYDREPLREDIYEFLAESVLSFLPQAENWWDSKKESART
jgi:hypothetical protein